MIKLFDSVDLIDSDEELCVVREGPVFYQDGKPVKRQCEQFKIYGNVQPMDEKELLLVPEGDRNKEQYWVFMNQCDKPLRLNDRVLRGCKQFQVQDATDWGSYTKARIVLIDVGPNA